MTARVMQEVKRLQQEGPSKDLTDRAKETARRGYETALKQNDYWLGRLQTIKTYNRDPGEILDAHRPDRRGDARGAAGGIQTILPCGSLDHRHVDAALAGI